MYNLVQGQNAKKWDSQKSILSILPSSMQSTNRIPKEKPTLTWSAGTGTFELSQEKIGNIYNFHYCLKGVSQEWGRNFLCHGFSLHRNKANWIVSGSWDFQTPAVPLSIFN